MRFFVAQNSEVDGLLSDAQFLRQWNALFENCDWATVFQSCIFVKTWHEVYKEVFDLLFVYELDENDCLTGLFPLAVEKATGKIVAAGSYHAEYQTWLASAENGDAFIEKAFDALRREFPDQKLELLFLAPRSPLGWIENKEKWGGQARLQTHSHPLIEIGDGKKSEESLRKKGNKTRFRQLGKIGEVRLEKIETPEELAEIFDEIEDYAKLRLSALHNALPAFDPHRKAFHLALMQIPNLLYVSLLKVGDQIASTKISLRNRDEMLLSITSMSPFLAHQSPSKLHILLLGKQFAAENIGTFDLSPGGGYKERFATHCKTVHSVKIFFNKQHFLLYKSKRKSFNLAKSGLEKLGVPKTKAFAFADKVCHKLSRVQYRTIPRTIIKSAGRKIYERREYRIYSLDARKIGSLENSDLMRRDAATDLLKYAPIEGWQSTVSEFHQSCLERFESGNHCYTFADADALLHYGWLAGGQEISRVSQVGQEFEIPPNSAVLYDFYTHPKARGRGLYQKSLLQCLHDAAQIPGTERVFISVSADNAPSRYVVEKTGFVYRGSLFRETRFGRVRKWQVWKNDSHEQLPEMLLKESFTT